MRTNPFRFLLPGLALCLILTACAAGSRHGSLPQGLAWPADPAAGQVFYDPTPLAGLDQAQAALYTLSSELALPDTLESWVNLHLTKNVLVVGLTWTQWEYRDVERWRLYPTHYVCRDWIFSDCHYRQPERVKAAKSDRLAMGLDEITAIRIREDNGVTLSSTVGSVTLLAPNRGAALDLADALYTMAASAGFTQQPGPRDGYRDLDPREAAALSTGALAVTGGVLVVSAPQGGRLGEAGLRHLDVILALDNAPATAQALTSALSAPGQADPMRAAPIQATVLRWTGQDARSRPASQVLTLTLR